uniref:Uncharacterized protein n=1 Tax=Rhizophora mucronata TaxID=61149 RepID=A0A2P2ISY1_RHIMU
MHQTENNHLDCCHFSVCFCKDPTQEIKIIQA